MGRAYLDDAGGCVSTVRAEMWVVVGARLSTHTAWAGVKRRGAENKEGLGGGWREGCGAASHILFLQFCMLSACIAASSSDHALFPPFVT